MILFTSLMLILLSTVVFFHSCNPASFFFQNLLSKPQSTLNLIKIANQASYNYCIMAPNQGMLLSNTAKLYSGLACFIILHVHYA